MKPKFRHTRKWTPAVALTAMGMYTSYTSIDGAGRGGTAPARRTITDVSPERGHADGGQTVMICTKGFQADFAHTPPSVFFGLARAMVARVDGNVIEVIVPPYTVGPIDVLVRVTDTWETARKKDGFCYHEPTKK